MDIPQEKMRDAMNLIIPEIAAPPKTEVNIDRIREIVLQVINSSVAEEQSRWQKRIYKTVSTLCTETNIDGAGCDSGDPLDVTDAEVTQGMAYFSDQLSEAKFCPACGEQIIQPRGGSRYCEECCWNIHGNFAHDCEE